MELIIQLYSFAALMVFFYMTAGFLIALVLRRNDTADVMWGIGFVFVAVILFSLFPKIDRSFFATLLVAIWGLRLSYHIFRRTLTSPEDKRYAVWRKEWKHYFEIRSYVQIFLLQGVLMLLIASPVLLITINHGGSLTNLDLVGLTVWIVGFIFESVGDKQLRDFIRKPENKGKIMNQGLWKYTRHPNYFGEVTQWWGLWIIALSVPYGYLGIIGPLAITFLILKVSGIPMLEKSFIGREGFDEYKRKTSVFFPWFPKR